MSAWDELHKKGYIPAPTSGPNKPKPQPAHAAGQTAKPAKDRRAGTLKAGLPDNSTPANQKDYSPGNWAHDIAVSMGFDDMPPEVEAEFAKLFTEDPSDQLHLKALAYLRGTDWHHQKYAGFAAGAKSGLWTQESEYNAWKSQATDAYRQYYGRAPTPAELASFAAQGFSSGTINQIGQGHAWAQANTGDVQYALGAFDTGQVDPNSLETLGQQYAGRGSAAGSLLQSKFENAMKKMQRVFEGTLASPNLSLGSGGLSAPSLNPKQSQDIGR